MKLLLLPFLFVFGFLSPLHAGTGHKIDIKIKNYYNDTLILGYYLGDKQFIKDTSISKTGVFTFSGKENLDPGIYLAVLLPEKNVFQFMVDDKNQQFSIEADAKHLSDRLSAKNSAENTLFFKYIAYISSKKPVADSLKKVLKITLDSTKMKLIQEKIKIVDEEVKSFQNKLIADNPKSFTAALINSSQEKNFPDYTNKTDAEKIKLYNHYKLHFFDDFNFSDLRLFRSPIYFQKVDFYVSNLTTQHPDSIIKSLDYILEKTQSITDAYQFFLSHYFNTYIKSKYVGMDAVYVHLIDYYYSKGRAPWVDEASLNKMKEAANDIRPTLIGRYAPNLTFFRQDSTTIKVHDIKAKYTVLFFWAPDCQHCEKAIPHVIDFYNQFKPQGVEILSICTGLLDEAKDCWKSVEKKHMEAFVNVNDPYLSSNFKVFYDIKSTPKFFILDKDKKIISKGIGAEQLGEVMSKIIEFDTLEKK